MLRWCWLQTIYAKDRKRGTYYITHIYEITPEVAKEMWDDPVDVRGRFESPKLAYTKRCMGYLVTEA